MRICRDSPVLFGYKGFNFAFALNDQPHCDRLHTTGRQTTGDFFPLQRRYHKADHTVEKTPGLLGIYAVYINITGLFKSVLDGIFGNFVKHYPFKALLITTDNLL